MRASLLALKAPSSLLLKYATLPPALCWAVALPGLLLPGSLQGTHPLALQGLAGAFPSRRHLGEKPRSSGFPLCYLSWSHCIESAPYTLTHVPLFWFVRPLSLHRLLRLLDLGRCCFPRGTAARAQCWTGGAEHLPSHGNPLLTGGEASSLSPLPERNPKTTDTPRMGPQIRTGSALIHAPVTPFSISLIFLLNFSYPNFLQLMRGFRWSESRSALGDARATLHLGTGLPCCTGHFMFLRLWLKLYFS